jgi:hypothetical protein
MSNHINNIVKKPWGYEYLAYQNDDVALWCLYIAYEQSTSMHCHPKKTTGLILLDGEVELSFLADSREMKSLNKAMIRRGLFHSTKATSTNGAFIFEIETPVDKSDLVRLKDKYGRESKPYEDQTFETPKSDDCIWIENQKSYDFANCKIKVQTINNIEFFQSVKDDELIVFLKGGMVRNIDEVQDCVTIPGDVGFGKIIKQVSKELDGVVNDTLIMIINKNG